MKTLDVILKKREELRSKLNNLESNKFKYPISKWSEMSDPDKREYSRLMSMINALSIQIDALTYVINYDSELRDFAEEPKFKYKSVDSRF